MKSTFDMDFEFREAFNIRDEMKTLETHDDFEFKLAFNASEDSKQTNN